MKLFIILYYYTQILVKESMWNNKWNSKTTSLKIRHQDATQHHRKNMPTC